MPTTPEFALPPDHSKVACHSCDKLFELPELRHGQRLRCTRCDSVLTDFSDTGIQRALALSIAGLVLLFSTFFFPMLQIQVRGQTSSINLIDSALMLFTNSNYILGGLVLVFILIVPLVILTAIILLSTCILFDYKNEKLVLLARGFYLIRDWNMVEVYLIGMMVSLTNLMELAEVSLGLSFWALIAFSLTFLSAIYNMDRHVVWSRIKMLLQR